MRTGGFAAVSGVKYSRCMLKRQVSRRVRCNVMSMFRSCLSGLLGCVVIVIASGCNPNTTAPTPGEPPSMTEVWSSTLAIGATKFYSFTVPLNGTVSVQLKSLTQDGAASAELVTLGLGQPRATDCAVGGSIAAAAADAVLLSGLQEPGVYCLRIWDNAQLSKPASFSVTINHPKQ